jgi:serine/threonine-protein kinase RsbW
LTPAPRSAQGPAEGRQLDARVARLEGAGDYEAELTLSLPSDVIVIEEAVGIVAELLAERFLDPAPIKFNIKVALCEALANAMLYGNGGDHSKMVEIHARYGRTLIEICITDQGDGFQPQELRDPTLPENVERADGRGVYLIQKLMDEVRYNEKGNSICMILRRA